MWLHGEFRLSTCEHLQPTIFYTLQYSSGRVAYMETHLTNPLTWRHSFEDKVLAYDANETEETRNVLFVRHNLKASFPFMQRIITAYIWQDPEL